MGPSEVKQSQNPVRDAAIRDMLIDRRRRLRSAVSGAPAEGDLLDLLKEVDAALERMDTGTYGMCDTCHDSIENERLLADPLCRNCLDHLSSAEQRVLERDLDLAYVIQSGLLPKTAHAGQGWNVAYHYQPAGPVSGDYCDLIPLEGEASLFLLGDVTGKGVAASMMMAHLHAIFRSLAGTKPRVEELMADANRIFCDGTISSFFATLVCGRLDRDGSVTIANAGHCRPLHLQQGAVSEICATGFPLGLKRDSAYSVHSLTLAAGDILILFSDGLSETFNPAGEEYGTERLASLVSAQPKLSPQELLAATLADLERFRAGRPRADDLTVMVIRRE